MQMFGGRHVSPLHVSRFSSRSIFNFHFQLDPAEGLRLPETPVEGVEPPLVATAEDAALALFLCFNFLKPTCSLPVKYLPDFSSILINKNLAFGSE